ncbi:MAG: protein kinase domain-containing protein, partial [Candidatus Binatia bacterium]
MIRLAPGQRVGDRYRLERELGRSRASSTWAAFDERLDRPVCVRIFDESSNRRSLTERAGRAASLTHPRAVRVFDTGFESGRFYTVCELLGGSVASQRLPLAPNESFRVATEVAEALAHAHEKGVVHGNVSESNVLLSSAGAKLGDFALAAGEDHDTRSDLAELGLLLRRLTGAQVGAVPDRPRGFGPIVEALARGAYDSAARLLDDLRAIGTPAVAPARTVERRRWLLAVAVVLVTLGVLGVLRLGERSPRTRLLPEGRIEGTPLQVAAIEDFDPLGDGREGRGTLRNIADGNPQTFWS